MKIIPVTGTIIRIYLLRVRIPAVPAFSDISICAKEIPVVVDQPPLALCPGSIGVLIPPAFIIFYLPWLLLWRCNGSLELFPLFLIHDIRIGTNFSF